MTLPRSMKIKLTPEQALARALSTPLPGKPKRTKEAAGKKAARKKG